MKVQDILTDESKFTRNAYARKANGMATSENDENAVCFCLLGALQLAYGNDSKEEEIVRETLRKRRGSGTIVLWNDSVPFSEVRALIEELDI